MGDMVAFEDQGEMVPGRGVTSRSCLAGRGWRVPGHISAGVQVVVLIIV